MAAGFQALCRNARKYVALRYIMLPLVDLARHYEANGLYRRERRPFRRRLLSLWRRVPDVRSLRPETRHEVFGGRTGFLDRVQGVFGYFFGGGWVYGLVENDRFRAHAAGYTAYQETAASDPLAPLPFRAGEKLAGAKTGEIHVPADPQPDLPADGYLQAHLVRNLLSKPPTYPRLDPDALPAFSHLRPIDQFAHLHDLQLRHRDERVWAGDLDDDSDEFDQFTRAANGALLNALKAEDWDGYRQEWRDAKSKLDKVLWEEIGSLLAYEKCVADFAVFFLSLPGWSDREMAPLLVPPPERMTLAGLRPVDAPFNELPKGERKAARNVVKACCSKAQTIRREAERQYQT